MGRARNLRALMQTPLFCPTVLVSPSMRPNAAWAASLRRTPLVSFPTIVSRVFCIGRSTHVTTPQDRIVAPG